MPLFLGVYLFLQIMDQLSGVLNHIRAYRYRGNTPFHQLLGQIRIYRRRLSADRSGYAPGSCATNNLLQCNKNSLIALIEYVGQLGAVPVDTESKLSEVV